MAQKAQGEEAMNNLATSTVTVHDLVDVLTSLTIETVAVLSANSKEADHKLEQVASHLLNLSEECDAARPKALLRTLAYQLMGTEEGAGIG